MKATSVLALAPFLATLAAADSGIGFYYSTDCTGEEDTAFGEPARGLNTCMGDLYSPASLQVDGSYPGYTVTTYSDSFCVDKIQTVDIGTNGACIPLMTNAVSYEIQN